LVFEHASGLLVAQIDAYGNTKSIGYDEHKAGLAMS
jgi:hypothetical protein